MKALHLADGAVSLANLPKPVPAADEALVRVTMAGICRTDIEIAKGYMGFSGVLGHELCGVVEACADAKWVGMRVAVEINFACGTCPTCQRGRGRHCPTRKVLGILGTDGCFAEYVRAPIRNLHALPDGLEDRTACFIEPVAAAYEVLEQVVIGPRDRVAVLGDGKLGLLVAQVLNTTGCTVLLVGHHARKLALAGKHGIESAGLADLPRKEFDVVVEATGSAAGMHTALELVRPRGTLVLKSTYHGMLSLDAAPLVIDELTLVGSRCGPFERAIPALATGRIDPSDLIDAVLPLSQAEHALKRASMPGTLKVLLDMRG